MSAYTRPAAIGGNVTFQGGSAYTRPAAIGGDVSFAPSTFVADIAALIGVTAAVSAAHGVAASVVAQVSITAEVEAEHSGNSIVADVSAAVGIEASVLAGHGVAAGVAAVVPVSAAAASNHGVAGDSAAVVQISAAISATHERYELRGEVRDGGILVNRRVRAYLRASGELLGQVDTVAGRFRVAAGFAAAECYVTPIDLSVDAVDWLPPTANRITSVLAQDTA